MSHDFRDISNQSIPFPGFFSRWKFRFQIIFIAPISKGYRNSTFRPFLATCRRQGFLWQSRLTQISASTTMHHPVLWSMTRKCQWLWFLNRVNPCFGLLVPSQNPIHRYAFSKTFRILGPNQLCSISNACYALHPHKPRASVCKTCHSQISRIPMM